MFAARCLASIIHHFDDLYRGMMSTTTYHVVHSRVHDQCYINKTTCVYRRV